MSKFSNLKNFKLNFHIKKTLKSNNLFIKHRINSSQKKNSTTKEKFLVIDLDETLIHTEINKNSNKINIRPFAKEFIISLSKFYNIFLFTASFKEYAIPIIKKIDTKNLIKKFFFREFCTKINEDVYIKDLSKLNVNLKDVVIIDNNINSFYFQKENGIPIKNFYDDQNDVELIKLIPILKNLAGFFDLRTEIKKFVKNNTFIWIKGINWVKENCLNLGVLEEIENVKKIEKKNFYEFEEFFVYNNNNNNNDKNKNNDNNNNNNNNDNEKNEEEKNSIYKNYIKNLFNNNINKIIKKNKNNFNNNNNTISSIHYNNKINNSNEFIKITNNYFYDNNSHIKIDDMENNNNNNEINNKNNIIKNKIKNNKYKIIHNRIFTENLTLNATLNNNLSFEENKTNNNNNNKISIKKLFDNKKRKKNLI